MKRIFKVLAISMVVAAILGTVLAVTVSAAGPQAGNDNSTAFRGGMGGVPSIDVVSKLLGLTEDQIREQRLAGKSLVQIAATKNVTEEALINAIIAERQKAVQARVTAGQITQAVADQQLAQMKERVKVMVERTTTGQPDWANGKNNANGKGNGMLGRGGMRGQANCDGTCNGTGIMQRAGRGIN